jgi:hypothetical protein
MTTLLDSHILYFFFHYSRYLGKEGIKLRKENLNWIENTCWTRRFVDSPWGLGICTLAGFLCNTYGRK